MGKILLKNNKKIKENKLIALLLKLKVQMILLQVNIKKRENKKKKYDINKIRHTIQINYFYLKGWISGAAGIIVGSPLDVLKVKSYNRFTHAKR